MSEHLTHIAVYEDCARIVLNTDKFCEAFRTCLKNQYDSGMLTCGARDGDWWAVPILEKYRNKWKNGEQGEEIQQMIAGAIGWLTHRASDLQMKPLFEQYEKKYSVSSSSEMQVYHDAVTIREVYDEGKLSTESPYEKISPATLEQGMASEPASKTVNAGQIEKLLTYMWQREFVEIHKFSSHTENAEAWIEGLYENYQPIDEDFRMYIEAFQNPDPVKMKKYIHDFNHYDPEDEIIQFVRGIQRNQPVDHINFESAIVRAATQSQYAQALHKCFNFILSAGEFFEYKLEKDQLYDNLDIKKKDRY